MWVTFVIFKIMTKVNNHPKGENSPNLVTLCQSFILEVRLRNIIYNNENANELLSKVRSNRPVLTPVHGMEYRVGLLKAVQ
jgi:hypothetical protein